jgi:hypothetical protein
LATPLDLGDRALEVGGGDRRGRRHAVVVVREDLPRPLVVDAALGHREGGVRCGPHRQALVGKHHLGVDAVAVHVAQALLGIGAGELTQPILALELVDAQPIRAVPLGHAPLHAVGVHDHPRIRSRYLASMRVAHRSRAR